MGTQLNRLPARDRLLDSAEALFYQEGIAQTGVDDVLAKSGVSVATLYAHFGSKDGLVRATLERRLSTWRSVWGEAVEAARSDEDRLLAIFDALELYRQRHQRARWCAFLTAAMELPSPDHPARPLVEADTALLAERLHLLAMPLTGDAADADELAESILLIYNGTLGAFLRGRPEDPVLRGRSVAKAIIASARGR